MTRAPGLTSPRLLFALLLGLALTGASLPTLADSGHHPVNLALLHPLSTNRDPQISTNLRLSLLFGRVGSLRGLDVNGAAAVLHGDLSGLQATGLVSRVEGSFKGVMLTGGLSNLAESGKGLQVTGLVNYVQGDFRGAQWAGLFNFTEQGFVGIQMTSLFNLNNGDGAWLQLSSLANANAGSFKGLQIAGGFNFSNEDLVGVQAGLANLSGEVRGLQIGLLNMARELSGLQIGVVNMAWEQQGRPIGLVNWSESADLDWIIRSDGLAAVSTGLRSRLRGLHSVVSLGTGNLQSDPSNTLFLGWHFGPDWDINPRTHLGLDLGFVHIAPQTGHDDPTVNSDFHYALQARLLGERVLSQNLALFLGGGVNTTFDRYSSQAGSSTEPIWVAGVALY